MFRENLNSIAEELTSYEALVTVDQLASWATNFNLPFVVYRLPTEDHFQMIIGSALTPVMQDDLASLKSGFLFSDYAGNAHFIDGGIRYSSKNKNLQIDANWPAQYAIDSITNQEQEWHYYVSRNEYSETLKADYIRNVERCIEEIKYSDLLKVVPSRTKNIELAADFNLLTTFEVLCHTYESAFVSILSTAQYGTWIGATPESLIEVDAQGIFTTMSLAGTQAYDGIKPLHTLPWTEKEIEEQAMVSRYIINRFKEIRLREFEEEGPKTVKAANMAHLCTTFTVDTLATNFPDLGSVMLKLLHPTSAVCGMPKAKAKEVLASIELHKRNLYSGYMGPINIDSASHIYVNLRCMEAQKNKATLFAGAGVTAYSVPEEEWLETELKCATMLNIINR